MSKFVIHFVSQTIIFSLHKHKHRKNRQQKRLCMNCKANRKREKKGCYFGGNKMDILLSLSSSCLCLWNKYERTLNNTIHNLTFESREKKHEQAAATRRYPRLQIQPDPQKRSRVRFPQTLFSSQFLISLRFRQRSPRSPGFRNLSIPLPTICTFNSFLWFGCWWFLSYY